MNTQLTGQVPYFVNRLRGIAETYRSKLFPAQYDVIIDVLLLLSHELAKGELHQLNRFRKHARIVSNVSGSREVINKNKSFRKELIGVVAELCNLPRSDSSELKELEHHLRLILVVSAIGPERQANLNGIRVSYPHLLNQVLNQLVAIPPQYERIRRSKARTR